MTERQALTEARKRWGKTAHIKTSAGQSVASSRGQDGRARLVGHVALGSFFEVHGVGPNWADAFASVRTDL